VQFDQSTSRLTVPRAEGALGPYLRAITAHKFLVPLVTLAAVLAAVVFVVQREPSYESTAQILISPVPSDDETFLGVQILRDTPGDPTRAVETAASLLDSPLAARQAAQRLGDGWTTSEVEEAVEVEAQGQSNVLAVTAKASDPDEAARVANEFADAALAVRTDALREQVRTRLADLETRLRLLGDEADTTTRAELAARISALESLQRGEDPTVSVLESARPPEESVGASSALIIGLALIAGFILATGAALLIETLDRRIRDQEELLHLYHLPILARVPPLPRSLRGKTVSPTAMPPAVREGYRTLLVQLEQHPTAPHTIMVTSATTGDGKTSSAISLAYSLVGAGHRVILIDFDLRKPNVGAALGVKATTGLVSLLASDAKLADLLVPAPELPPLKVVPAGSDGDVVLLEALTRRLPDVLKEAEELADYVILDTPPLGEVSDALRMSDHVDATIVVARPGNTDRANFEVMRDLLEQTNQTPLGFVVIGVSQGPSTYYTYGLPHRSNGAGARLTRSADRA
jgi:capsular exopolysaccharide synthesis family protein